MILKKAPTTVFNIREMIIFAFHLNLEVFLMISKKISPIHRVDFRA